MNLGYLFYVKVQTFISCVVLCNIEHAVQAQEATGPVGIISTYIQAVSRTGVHTSQAEPGYDSKKRAKAKKKILNKCNINVSKKSIYLQDTYFKSQWARKLKKVQDKKLVKSNKSTSRKFFLTKFHFLQFQKWPKITF